MRMEKIMLAGEVTHNGTIYAPGEHEVTPELASALRTKDAPAQAAALQASSSDASTQTQPVVVASPAKADKSKVN